MAMTSRERVIAALNHQEPDRIPIDIGGTASSTIAAGPYRLTAEKLNIDISPTYMVDVGCQTVMVNEEMMTALGSDAKLITYMPDRWVDGQAYDGTPVKLPAAFITEDTPQGDKVIMDTNSNVAMKMPAGGYFYDPTGFPLKGVSTPEELLDHLVNFQTFSAASWLDRPLERMGPEVAQIRAETDRVLIGDFQAQTFMGAQILRGWTEFMLDMIAKPKLAGAILDRLTESHIRNFDALADHVGEHLDIIQLCDDLGMQDAPWMSPRMYREIIKPCHKRLIDHIKERCPQAYILLHSDGSMYSLIEDLLDVGVQILNPIQYTCKNMELDVLKKEFGQDLVFWGAGVDTQQTLPFASAQQVRDEVKRTIDVLAPGGGFVFATVHNITEGVPADNVLAAFQTAMEHGKY